MRNSREEGKVLQTLEGVWTWGNKVGDDLSIPPSPFLLVSHLYPLPSRVNTGSGCFVSSQANRKPLERDLQGHRS